MAWSAISRPLGAFSAPLGVIGVMLVGVGVVGYVRDHRRGGGDHQKLVSAIFLGAVISAPGVVVPVMLNGVDYIVNNIVHLLHSAAGGGLS